VTAAADAVAAWVNARPGLAGEGCPLSRGAFTDGQIRSPADGAYALLLAEMGTDPQLTAEPGGPVRARITAHVYAGTVDASEAAATALLQAWQTLAGCPEPCGGTGVLVMAAANFSGTGLVPPPASGGEVYEHQASADFVLLNP
jgi:hypothetical protein